MRFVIDSKGNLIRVWKSIKRKENIVIPSNTRCIAEEVFANCMNLKALVVPDGVREIKHHAFSCCKNLRSVELPDSLAFIGASTFFNCYALNSISMPEFLDTIPMHMFYNCGNLDYIYLPQSLKEIEQEAFYGCANLDNVMLPDSLTKIESGAFERCRSLKSIILPSKIKTIEFKTFKDCASLEDVTLPQNLQKIDRFAFDSCSSLENIEIPDSIKEIGEKAFFNTAIYRVKLPDTIEKLSYDAFSECYNIKQFVFGNRKLENINDLIGLKRPSFFEGLFLCDEVLDESVFRKIVFDNRDNISNVTNSLIATTIFNKEDVKRRKELACLLPLIIGKSVDEENYKTIKHELRDNYKEFNNLLKRLSVRYDIFKEYSNRLKYYDLYRFARLLGAFNDNQVERQKACEFIATAFEKETLEFFTLHSSFEGLEFKDYNKELAEFIMDKKNFETLMDSERDVYGMVARVCNSFEKIREFGRRNRGSQNYRKVTLEMCQKYFSTGEFAGVDETNEDISMAMYMFTREQATFDSAVEIRKEFNKLKSRKKVSEHILNEELSSQINDIRKATLIDIKNTVSNLSKVANKNFTYEFLAKSDPRNYVLGKYCSCCAHLEGAGKGIVKASILHPDCQNLVIKTREGKIVAKSTLYINRDQGYGVFNNVEVNENIEEAGKRQIYLTYKDAIERFVKRYNELNPKKPIKQINVGMNLNDLKTPISRNDEKADIILKGLNFAEFGNYSGDWQDEQYVLWRSEDKKGTSKGK